MRFLWSHQNTGIYFVFNHIPQEMSHPSQTCLNQSLQQRKNNLLLCSVQTGVRENRLGQHWFIALPLAATRAFKWAVAVRPVSCTVLSPKQRATSHSQNIPTDPSAEGQDSKAFSVLQLKQLLNNGGKILAGRCSECQSCNFQVWSHVELM